MTSELAGAGQVLTLLERRLPQSAWSLVEAVALDMFGGPLPGFGEGQATLW